MLDQQTKQRIISEETSRFMDNNFGQLDLSGSPDLSNPPAEDKFELQDRYGFNRVDESGLAGINQLKELLANPPRDVVEEIAKETQNPDLMTELANERAGEIANEFRRRNPGYLKCDANWRSIVETMAEKLLGENLEAEEAQELLIANGQWTLQNLTEAFRQLDRVGALEYPTNHSRPLREGQRLRAEQLSANGDVISGIFEYVKGRISEEAAIEVASTLEDPLAFTTDPKMRPILEEACLFCWEAYRKDYSPSPDRRRFLREYCAGRFVTIALLDAAWEECKRAERDDMRPGIFNQIGTRASETIEGPSASLDSLDDAVIDDLYHKTLKEYARTVKRQSGLLV